MTRQARARWALTAVAALALCAACSSAAEDIARRDEKPVVPSAVTLQAGRSRPVEDPYYPDVSNPEVDVLHYFLDLDWDGTTLRGTATLTFRPVESGTTTRLDLSNALHVSAVELDGAAVPFDHRGIGLDISTHRLAAGATHTFQIHYEGEPRTTPAPSLRPDMAAGLGWNVDREGHVYALQEPYGAFTWYPVNDHPSDEALYDARITTHGDDVAVFSGDLVARDRAGDVATSAWHVDEPLASYLTTMAVGPYQEYVDETPAGGRISYWLMPRDKDLLPKLEADGDAAYDWLVRKSGPYPFSTLGVVVVGGTSGMETQTMITMSREAVERSDAVLLHEMAHQWYGDSVTPTDWTGVWLNEGWAMYMQQWFETDTGMAVFGGGMRAWWLLDNASRILSGPPGHYNPQSFGDSNVYLGPAMMLDRIRQRVGDVRFEQLVRAWPQEHANENVDRDTFVRWLDAETGRDFGPLVARWLDSPRTPR